MPDTFFDPDGALPETVEHVCVPAHLSSALAPATGRHLANAIERRVRDARVAMARQGKKFLGAKTVVQQPFDAAPKTTEPRRGPNPRIAAAHTPERIQAIRNLVVFLRVSAALRFVRWRKHLLDRCQARWFLFNLGEDPVGRFSRAL